MESFRPYNNLNYSTLLKFDLRVSYNADPLKTLIKLRVDDNYEELPVIVADIFIENLHPKGTSECPNYYSRVVSPNDGLQPLSIYLYTYLFNIYLDSRHGKDGLTIEFCRKNEMSEKYEIFEIFFSGAKNIDENPESKFDQNIITIESN